MSGKIKCVICDKEFNVISWRHLRNHGLTLTEYKEQYPNSPIYSSEALINKKKSATRANKQRKGVPRSPEVNEKISKTKKANKTTAWNKGIPMPDNQKSHLSELKKQQYIDGDITHWNTDNTTPDSVRKKISESLIDKHLTYSEYSKQLRAETITIKKDKGWMHHNTLAFMEKLQNSTNADAATLYNDREWLYKQHITNKRSIASICVMLGLHWQAQASTIANKLKMFNIPIHRWSNNISVQQQEIEDFLEIQGIEYLANSRKIIPPYELDIYIPKYDLAIEYNGLFWHSEVYKDESYHLMKTELCETNGIRLIHIFEDEWLNDCQKCKDTLIHLFNKSEKGVYARKTKIREIPWKQAKDFLDKYHLLNAGTSGNYRIGAFDGNDNLIAVMVFGNMNNERSDGDAVELRRFVTDKRNNPGLGSKMFKYAVTAMNYSEVIAFVDRRWFTGLVKQYIGFKVIGVTKPAIWWTDGKHRYHRRFITKERLIKMGSDPSLTKREMLFAKKFIRIWDCGKLKLQWVRS